MLLEKLAVRVIPRLPPRNLASRSTHFRITTRTEIMDDRIETKTADIGKFITSLVLRLRFLANPIFLTTQMIQSSMP